MTYFNDFFHLLFPVTCQACGRGLYQHEQTLCSFCIRQLPRTKYHIHQDNPVQQIFWGRLPLHSSAAFLFFHKHSKIQHLIHQLKYKGCKDVGIFLGDLYGKDLKKSELFGTVDVIIPVPLHKSRLKKRGYNQSEMFAAGLAKSMHVHLDKQSLYRTSATETQTKKSKSERWKNVSEKFALQNPEMLAHKHLLLVDDIITTGSTIEACGQILMQIPGVKLSVAAIAFASHI